MERRSRTGGRGLASGDFARKPSDVPALLERLHGAKHLVRGNNDPPGTTAAAGWASVSDYAEMEIEGRRLVLCHYPFRSWNGQHKGAIDLHGHSHFRLKALPRQIDVGVELVRFSSSRRKPGPMHMGGAD